MLDDKFFDPEEGPSSAGYVPRYTYRNNSSFDVEPSSPAYPRSAPYDSKTDDYYRKASDPVFKF